MLAACFVGGSGCLAVAYAGEVHWKWNGVGPAIWVNFGSALILVAALFFVEPRFTNRVAQAAVLQAESQFDALTQQLSGRLDDLQSETDDLVGLYRESEDQAVARIGHEQTYQSIAYALATANRRRVVDRFGVTVPATTELPPRRIAECSADAWCQL